MELWRLAWSELSMAASEFTYWQAPPIPTTLSDSSSSCFVGAFDRIDLQTFASTHPLSEGVHRKLQLRLGIRAMKKLWMLLTGKRPNRASETCSVRFVKKGYEVKGLSICVCVSFIALHLPYHDFVIWTLVIGFHVLCRSEHCSLSAAPCEIRASHWKRDRCPGRVYSW